MAEIIGWPDVPTTGVGVWIEETLRFNVEPDNRERRRRVIVPVDARPSNWRKNRDLLTRCVQLVAPNAHYLSYKGGVAHYETSRATYSAHCSGYDGSLRRAQDARSAA